MKIGVNLRINLDKVDESKVFNGKKGRYLDMTAFIDIDNFGQYGDNGMIKQDSKEGDTDGAILGNATLFWNDSQPLPAKPADTNQGNAPQQSQAPQQAQAKDYSQDINTYWALESDQARNAHWPRLKPDVQQAIIAANNG